MGTPESWRRGGARNTAGKLVWADGLTLWVVVGQQVLLNPDNKKG